MHHTIKTKTGEINVFVIKTPNMLELEIIEAMQKGVVIVAQPEIRAVEILARFMGVTPMQFYNALERLGSWQGAWDYFKGEK